MPEIAPAPPAPIPAPPAPTPAPPAPTPVKPSEMAVSFDTVIPKAEPPKPEPAKPAAPAVVAKTPEPTKEPPKPASATPTTEPEVDWTKAPTKWYKIYEGYKGKTGKIISDLQEKIKTLEAKPQTAAGNEKIEQYEKQIEELRKAHEDSQKRLIETDYARSDEYKKKYIEPFQREKQSAFEEVKGLQFIVKPATEDAEAVTRQATEADFMEAMNLPPSRQGAFINEHFGASAWLVIQRIVELSRIKREAQYDVQNHAEQFQKTQQEQESKTKKELDFVKTERAKAHAELEEKWPALFSVKHYESDPDAKKMLEDGYAYVDRSEEEIDTMPPEEKAALASVLRARAASAPLLNLLLERQTAKITELEQELAKYRGSDPGATKGEAPTVPAPVKSKGIQEAALEAERAMNAGH